MNLLLNLIKDKIIVSCQAMPNEPLYKEDCMLAMMHSVINGNAAGLRVAGTRDIKNAKKHFDVPVIGITKPDMLPDNWQEIVYITPTLEDVRAVIDAGADIVAFDGTLRKRPDNSSLSDVINMIHESNKLAMADISTYDEGCTCAKLGADILSTTLSGYTKESNNADIGPDFNLLQELHNSIDIPVILEGRIWELEDVKKAFVYGAHSVVIGSAITRPQLITKRFTEYRG